MELIRPAALRPGARVAAYTPSFPAAGLFPLRLQRGVDALRRAGFEVVVPDAATRVGGYKAGSAKERATALMELFDDPDIDGIVCTIGGFNSNAILPHLDYGRIRSNAKVLVGHSDATALLLAIYERAGVITFYGPALLPEWGESGGPLGFTLECFLAVAQRGEKAQFRPPAAWTNEFLDWASGADERARRMQPHTGWRALRPGRAEGRLVGGNIETINAIVGTPYCPSLEGALLFIEATEAEAYLPRIERALDHLDIAGHMKDIRALLVARCPDATPERGVDLDSLLCEIGGRLRVLVVADLDFGHTDPKLTLPIGVEAEIVASASDVRLRLLAPAVRRDD